VPLRAATKSNGKSCPAATDNIADVARQRGPCDHRPMKVIVSFAEHFDGQIADAAWLIESPSNRKWINTHWSQLDPNSATFRSGSDVIDILDNVFEHHPNWTEVVVQNAGLTPRFEASLSLHAKLALTNDGFTISRV